MKEKHIKEIAEILHKSLIKIDEDNFKGGKLDILGFNANELVTELSFYFEDKHNFCKQDFRKEVFK